MDFDIFMGIINPQTSRTWIQIYYHSSRSIRRPQPSVRI